MTNLFSIRFFNDEGIAEFERVVGEIRNGNLKRIPESLITDDQFSETAEPLINIESIPNTEKSVLVPYLVGALNLRSNKGLYFNRGLWTWLSAFYFENVCPADGRGVRKVNESAFYILKDPKNHQKYYRHLLAYPCRLYSELGELSKMFLIGTFQKRGEITEQFGAYQEIALNKGILEAATLMYWDEQNGKLKKGAAGKGAGSARRLVRIIRQYQLTYDLNSMSGKEIADLMPSEFSKWGI